MAPQTPDKIEILGQSASFLDLLERVSQAAVLDRPVLVIGERGTGKELIANRLHFLSPRWGAPYVQINCAALPETLLESELFGYEPGAFTGATSKRTGRFEQADGGTLFLDEIATLSPAAQEKLLRIVEYGRFERLGGRETIEVDVRVVGATNVDLPAASEAGRFRADLLDRLSFDVLTVPPLRVRHGDVLLLARHFGRAMSIEIGWPSFPGFSRLAENALVAHSWPGNIRELKNTVERAVYRWPHPTEPIDTILFDPFESAYRLIPEMPPERIEQRTERTGPPVESKTALPGDFKTAVADFEKDLLARAYEAHRFNQRETAAALSLSYDQLRHALKKHGLL
jgi:psp operon transcriptional activator